MYKLKKIAKTYKRIDYYGFPLKESYWYGFDTFGYPVAVNTKIHNSNVEVHICKDGIWYTEMQTAKTPPFPAEFLQHLESNVE